MITVSGPLTAISGTTVYATASGFSSGATVTGNVCIGPDKIPSSLVQKPNGAYQLCATIPSGTLGAVDFKFGDGAKWGSKSVIVTP